MDKDTDSGLKDGNTSDSTKVDITQMVDGHSNTLIEMDEDHNIKTIFENPNSKNSLKKLCIYRVNGIFKMGSTGSDARNDSSIEGEMKIQQQNTTKNREH